MRLLCDVWVPGLPKTKGSMTARPNGSMRESVAGSTRWRRLVADAVRRDATARCDGLRPVPVSAPIMVIMQSWMLPPVGPNALVATYGAPLHERSGDVDKQARNVLDAIARTHVKDAGLIADDVLVDSVYAEKFLCDPDAGDPPGLALTVWAGTADSVQRRRASARANRDRLLGVVPV